MSAIKKIEMRRCVSCREIRHKSEFLRIVKSPAGEVALDFSGKAPGRGAYVFESETPAEPAAEENPFSAFDDDNQK